MNILEVGFLNLQASDTLYVCKKELIQLADLLSVACVCLERSRLTFKTQLRSPPNINLCEFKSGNHVKRLVKNCTLSQFGA